MKILVLGGRGMLGHKIVQRLQNDFELWATFRQPADQIKKHPLFNGSQTIIGNLDVTNFPGVEKVIGDLRPDVVINCIGIIKQLKEAKDPLISIEVNALLPHRLAKLCRELGCRLITVSTDCVFSGVQGNYQESDNPDPLDLYGRSKHLGEVDDGQNLTLRTSIIGRELETTTGLIEWFYSQKRAKIRGFSKAIYSGLTTIALADILKKIILDHPELNGLYHLSSDVINKYDLLCDVRDQAQLEIEIERDDIFEIDRSLNSKRFSDATGIIAPSWEHMINEMVADPTPYDEWRELNDNV